MRGAMGRLKSDKSDVLARLPNAERRHPLPVPVDKRAHPVWVCLAVVPQSPADGLVYEKFRLTEVVYEDFFEQGGVGLVLPVALMVDCSAAQPDIFVGAPP